MAIIQTEAHNVAQSIVATLNLNQAISALENRTTHHSLSLCVLDAVYSIRVKYQEVLNVLQRYCTQYGLPWPHQRARYGPLPRASEQESISALLGRI